MNKAALDRASNRKMPDRYARRLVGKSASAHPPAVAAAGLARARRGDLRLVRLEGTRESKYMFSLHFSQSHISSLLLRLGLTFETGGSVNLKIQPQSHQSQKGYETGFSCGVNGLVCKIPSNLIISILSTRARANLKSPRRPFVGDQSHNGRGISLPGQRP
jgi:hypothetical protein